MSSAAVTTSDVVIVSGLFGHGTTYYTNYLNTIEGNYALHEYVYNDHGFNPPAEGQTHDVGGWSLPFETDVLLVRDPRKALRSLRKHSPTYQLWTHRRFGYHPHSDKLFMRSWCDWYELALERDPEIVRIEDVPKVDVPNNAETRGRKRPYSWDELSTDVRALAARMGYNLLL